MPATRYRLGRDTRAVQCEDGANGFVLIPEGALLTVDSFDPTGRLVKVAWGRQLLLMFRQDLIERGIEMDDPGPTGAHAPAQPL
jgi:hypothetical protein